MRISDWSSDVCSSDILEAQAAGHSVATLRRRLATLSHLHDALCVANPTRNRAVKLTLRGLTRTRGARPRHRRAPLRQGDVESMIATLGDSRGDLRDQAQIGRAHA